MDRRRLKRTMLTSSIRRHAHELGFDLVGFTPADPLEGAEFYARWVTLGYAGEMEYLKRHLDRRRDPRKLVAGARSVICVGMLYYQPAARTPDPLSGTLACYARGDDYHDVVKARLADLWRGVVEAAGHTPRGRYYVDTAPVLERELASRAGLGWWGKNTCLINPRLGSFVLIGEIITDLVLEYDQPAVDHCGTCTRCLEACPTEAFPEAYVLDARRCLSYLTIEHRGPIPLDLRPRLGNRVLGCDVCQDVCPWNRRVTRASEPAFGAREGLDPASLIELLRLDAEAFSARFRRHPAKRPKRRGLLRNVAVALGNSGCQEAVPHLVHALTDAEPLVRGHAAWALGQLGGAEARRGLSHALKLESDEEVIQEIQAALGALT